MPVQRIPVSARGSVSAGSLSASDVATLTHELTNALVAVAGLLERLTAATIPAPTEHSAHLPQVVPVTPITPAPGPAPANTVLFTPSPVPVSSGRSPGLLLKVLLRQRHWQTYNTFCRQFDLAAKTVDPSLVGTYPSRAQLHRWMHGQVKGLPYPDSCRVLEAMFPGHTVEQLFSCSELQAVAS